MPDIPPSSPHRMSNMQHQRYTVPLTLLLLFVGFALLLGYDLYSTYQREYQVARREAENLSQLIERQVRAAMEKSDIVLRQVVREYTPAMTGHAPLPAPEATNRALREIMSTLPETQKDSLRIIDADGNVVYSAGDSARLPEVKVGDRAYFLTQKNNPDAGLVVSEPILSRFTGKWLFTVSRRFAYPDGRFAGLVQTAVRADYLQEQVFDAISIGKQANVALFDEKFRLVSRKPLLQEQLGKAFALTEISNALAAGQTVGSYTVVSRVDGVYREYRFRKLEGFPFILNVGFAPDDILQEWRQKVWLYSLSMLAMLVLLFALLRAIRQSARERLLQLKERFARESAEQTSNAKSRFLAIVSHEIKTPLHGMRGMVEVLSYSDLNPEQQAYVQTALDCGHDLEHIVNSILSFSQLETGQLQAQSAPFALPALLEECFDTHAEAARQKGLAFHVEHHCPLPAQVAGDAGMLHQVLDQLLSNATKYTRQGSITCTVSRGEASAGRTDTLFPLRIKVADTGSGMSPDVLARLFQPFAPGDASNTRQQGGLGLGLAIAQRQVGLMGGHLQAESSPDHGACFTLELPLPVVPQ